MCRCAVESIRNRTCRTRSGHRQHRGADVQAVVNLPFADTNALQAAAAEAAADEREEVTADEQAQSDRA